LRHAFTVKIEPLSAFSGFGPFGIDRARVAPCAGPHVRQRIDLGVGVRFLVGDERAIRRVRRIGARFPANLPEHVVAAEEREVHAGVARRFDVGALRSGPVLVVPDRQKHFVVLDERAAPIAVETGRVADVVAVRFEPAHHRVLGVEHQIDGAVVARHVRPVHAHLVGALLGIRGIEAAIGAGDAGAVVGLPRGVGGLEQQIGSAGIVSNDEVDVTRARLLERVGETAETERAVGVRSGFGRVAAAAASATGIVGTPARRRVVLAHEARDVDAGHRVARDGPRGRDCPVAAVVEAHALVPQTRGLRLWKRHRWAHGGDASGASAAVVAKPIDVDAVLG
jgi:hypothetical protein